MLRLSTAGFETTLFDYAFYAKGHRHKVGEFRPMKADGERITAAQNFHPFIPIRDFSVFSKHFLYPNVTGGFGSFLLRALVLPSGRISPAAVRDRLVSAGPANS